MKKLTNKQIKEINEKCPYEQGIFLQPHGVPFSIKELVVYGRYRTGGYSGGNCWGDEAQYEAEIDIPVDKMKVLDLVLEELKPDITLLEYRKVEREIQRSDYTHSEYYGNSDSYNFEYITLTKLYEILGIK